MIALAPRSDPRVHAFSVAHPRFDVMLSRFTDAFRDPLDPIVLIVRNDVLPNLAHVELLASFRESPDLPDMKLTEIDEPLFDALLRRWKRHYLGNRQRWQDRALFRSLNMANQAAKLPASIGTTLYDLGRMAALWVSAFEILAHPRTANSGLKSVYPLFERISYRDRNVGRRRYLAI